LKNGFDKRRIGVYTPNTKIGEFFKKKTSV
jgi:hypothetical protein